MLAVLTNQTEPVLTYLISYDEDNSNYGYIEIDGKEQLCIRNIHILIRRDGTHTHQVDSNCRYHDTFILKDEWEITYGTEQINELYIEINRELNSPEDWRFICTNPEHSIPNSTIFVIQTLQHSQRERCNWEKPIQYNAQSKKYV